MGTTAGLLEGATGGLLDVSTTVLLEGATGGLLDVSTTGPSGKVPGSSAGASGVSAEDEPWLC